MMNNTTAWLQNFTTTGWYMIPYEISKPFSDVVFPLLYIFVFTLTFIRTRDFTTCAFVSILFTALYVALVPEWFARIVYMVTATLISAVFYIIFRG